MKIRSLVRVLAGLSFTALLAACSSSTGGAGGGGGGAPEDECTEEGAFQACYLDGDPDGAPSGGQQCVSTEDDVLAWNECQDAGTASSTPLVLSFDGASVRFGAAAGHFDLAADASFATDWPAASTPWLALDRSGDGRIEGGAELFGSATPLSDGALAPHGFAALAELDTDGDGRITPADAAWSRLVLWSDADQDRVSSGSELRSLDAHGVVAIDLAYDVDRRCDARGNCEIERASFVFRSADGELREGAVIDVHLRHR